MPTRPVVPGPAARVPLLVSVACVGKQSERIHDLIQKIDDRSRGYAGLPTDQWKAQPGGSLSG